MTNKQSLIIKNERRKKEIEVVSESKQLKSCYRRSTWQYHIFQKAGSFTTYRVFYDLLDVRCFYAIRQCVTCDDFRVHWSIRRPRFLNKKIMFVRIRRNWRWGWEKEKKVVLKREKGRERLIVNEGQERKERDWGGEEGRQRK